MNTFFLLSSGRKLRLRHFRDGIELPWLSADDNYNFDYQQNRPLLEEVKILPGDQITYGRTILFPDWWFLF